MTPGHKPSAKAKTDPKSICGYAEKTFGRAQALRYVEALSAKLDIFGRHPEVGRIRADIDEATRSLFQGSHIVPYEIRSNSTV